MRSIRLTLAALVAVAVSLLYFYTFEHQTLAQSYRCFRGAHHWYACLFDKDNIEFRTDYFGLQYQGNTRDHIDKHVLYFGAYEKPILYFMRDVMASLYHHKGVFLDVGANNGLHSLFMSPYVTAVHAFDPYEPVLQKFRKSIEENKIKNIVIHAVGLGEENLLIPFFEPPTENEGTGSFVENFSYSNKPYKTLPIVNGDEWLKNIGVAAIALIKMDIEGYEKLALRGLRQTLITFRPIVVFEMSVGRYNLPGFKSKEDLRAGFPEGYEFFVFRKPYDNYKGTYEFLEFDSNVRFDQPLQFDVVAFPGEKKNKLPGNPVF